MDIVAHRGFHRDYPENSLPAFKAAWDFPLQWAECDVHVLPDGVVLLHDQILDRMTEKTGSIYEQTAGLLGGCRLRDGSGNITSYLIPRLSSVIAQMPVDARLLVELKGSSLASDYIEILMREIGVGKVLIQSFNPRHLLLAHRYDRLMRLAYLVETEEGFFEALKSPYSAVHAKHEMLDEKKIRLASQAGKAVGAWTVNDPRDIRRMIDLAIDMLITDEPALAVEMLEQHKDAGL